MSKFLWRDGVLYSQWQFISVKVVDGKIIIPSDDDLAALSYIKHTGMYGGREFKDGKLIHGMVFDKYCTVRTYEQGRLLHSLGKL